MRGFFDPGVLNHRIHLERPNETTDLFGGMTISWTHVAAVWAGLQPMAASFRQIAQQTSEEQTHSIVIRYREDVSSGWRINLNQRFFEIESVFDPD